MNTKHTPGPWSWENAESIKHAERGAVLDDSGAIIAMCTREDARLIAAAPDLLEACRAIVTLMDGQGRANLPMIAGQAAAAIAKAEGRE